MLYGAAHVQRYRETDGQEGHDWNGTQALILTTTGRKSGQSRDCALIYGLSGDNPIVVASKGGAPANPDWYFNLAEQPVVEVQVRGDRFSAHDRTATGAERGELWTEMLKHWPQYADYQTKTEREIPVVVLDRV